MEKVFNHKNIEKQALDSWNLVDAFRFDLKASEHLPRYTVMLPPPNVTGSLHVGHALCYTLQDILIRYKRMKGFNVLWQLGLDHAGIVTQILVEKELASQNIDRRDIGREKFMDAVWSWKERSGGVILGQMERLGVSADFTRTRFTMDEQYQGAVKTAFIELFNEGLIYRDKRLVNWDPTLKSAISDLEVVGKEIDEFMWYIKYPLAAGHDECCQKYITIATTRPETMLADVAIAVHPDDVRYKNLVGQFVQLPLTDRVIPIVADEYSDQDKGTGAVKITPAHDFNDFEVGKRHNLDVINILTPDGLMNDSVDKEYQGLTKEEARALILERLNQAGLLEKEEKIKHTVPFGDRSSARIEPYLTEQWFLDTSKVAEEAIKVVKDGSIKFVPKNWENTYFDWMNNIKPWCISRQIWWGHQIPAWYGNDGAVFVAQDELSAQELAKKHYKTQDEVELKRDEDVLDTWFSSGMWTFITLGWPEKTDEISLHNPTDVLITGFDIIFFWVARMIMLTTKIRKQIPFKEVYIHAIVRDEKGQKMSKSKGNVLDPLDLIDEFGADALRFAISASSTPSRSINMGKSKIAGYRNFMTKLWNATRFVLMNDCKYEDEFDCLRARHPINRWIISKVVKLSFEVEKFIEIYRFDEASRMIYQTIWGDFCDWYLELIKPIFNSESDEELTKETRMTCGFVLSQLIKILHPFVPFITEELARAVNLVKEGELLSLSSWSNFAELPDEFNVAEQEIDRLQNLISIIRSTRSDFGVSPSVNLKLIVSSQKDEIYSLIKQYIVFCNKLCKVELAEDETTLGQLNARVPIIIEGEALYLEVGGSINLEQESLRLKKEEAKLIDERSSILTRLNNQGFISKASEETKAQHKDQLEKTETRLARIKELLTSLEHISS